MPLIDVTPENIKTILEKVPYYPDEIWKFTAMTKRFPTVDAVQVVRCKDCKYFLRHTQVDTDRGDCACYGVIAPRVKRIDDYCSMGRRDEE